MRIWAANQPNADADELVDLSSGADFILVRRAAEGVELRRIAAAEFAMLDALSQGARLIGALESAYAVDPDFDLAEALRRLIALDVLIGIQPASSPPPGETLS